MSNRDRLPMARVAGSIEARRLARVIAIAAALTIGAAMVGANTIGAALIAALIGGLWLHRRQVVDVRPTAPMRPILVPHAVRAQAFRIRATVVLSIAAILVLAWAFRG